MKEPEMAMIAGWMDTVVSAPDDEVLADRVAGEIKDLCRSFPAPGLS